jgi:DNA repair protein RadA
MQILLGTLFTRPQRPVSSLGSLTFGIEELDGLLGGLRVGDFAVFHGSWMCNALSELLCIRSQFSTTEGGLESSAVFIDGGNIFDVYFISEASRELGLNPEETLRNIWISRAFTCYQLTTLITEELPMILDREGSRLVVISNITSLYCDPDIGAWEAKRIFNRVTLFLWKLVRQRDIILVATSLSSRAERKWRLEQYLLGRADIAARVEGGNPHVKITLEKHPSNPTGSVERFLGASTIDRQLEDFMED